MGVVCDTERMVGILKMSNNIIQSLTTLSQFTIYMLVPIFMCAFLGIYIDRKAGTSYWMVILFFVGAIAGFRNVYKLAKKISSMKGDVRNRDKGKNTK